MTLFLPKQRKFGITLVEFRGKGFDGYVGKISRWTQSYRRQTAPCCVRRVVSGRAAISLEKPGRVGRDSGGWRLTCEMQGMRQNSRL